MTARLEEISNWLMELLPHVTVNSLNYIESDASARRYLRCVLDGTSHIIMDTVPGQEQVNFVKIAKILTTNKINAPEIIHNDLERGLILMNDFGDKTYLSVLESPNQANANQLYLNAISSLINIQQISKHTAELAVMDNAYIDNRLQVFKTWYLQQHLKIEIDSKIDFLLSELHKIFAVAFSDLPQMFVHVDYHSRNLMYLSDTSSPGVLDFQDAMFGPMTYDLVSLFQDAYITWPRQQVENWVRIYYNAAVTAGLIDSCDFKTFLRNFDMVGLQRHIKNLGVFARLKYRDNKPNYLNSIPVLLNYIMDSCYRYPELAILQEFLEEHVLHRNPISA